jgi:hypothetical protein
MPSRHAPNFLAIDVDRAIGEDTAASYDDIADVIEAVNISLHANIDSCHAAYVRLDLVETFAGALRGLLADVESTARRAAVYGGRGQMQLTLEAIAGRMKQVQELIRTLAVDMRPADAAPAPHVGLPFADPEFVRRHTITPDDLERIFGKQGRAQRAAALQAERDAELKAWQDPSDIPAKPQG